MEVEYKMAIGVGIWMATGLLSVAIGFIMDMIYPELKDGDKMKPTDIMGLILVSILFGPVMTWWIIGDVAKMKKNEKKEKVNDDDR